MKSNCPLINSSSLIFSARNTFLTFFYNLSPRLWFARSVRSIFPFLSISHFPLYAVLILPKFYRKSFIQGNDCCLIFSAVGCFVEPTLKKKKTMEIWSEQEVYNGIASLSFSLESSLSLLWQADSKDINKQLDYFEKLAKTVAEIKMDHLQEVRQIELLCKQLYESQDSEHRAEAEKSLVGFQNAPDTLTKCQLLLDRGDSAYAQLLAATTLTKLVSRSAQGLSLQQRLDISTWPWGNFQTF